MKILHLMLSNFYIDKANYQENALTRQNKKDGHEVKIIASLEVFSNNNKLGLISPKSYINEDGIPVQRIPYTNFLSKFISKKIRSYPNLYDLIAEFDPQIIFFHGAAAYALITVAKYKKNNPHVKFYVDSHEDFNNSSRNFLSKHVLHKIFYKTTLQKSLPFIDKIFYITYEARAYLKEIYNISDEYLHFLPLGGFIPEQATRLSIRREIRNSFGLTDQHILLIHSGKLDAKKRTVEIVKAFNEVKDDKLRLLIIGSMDDDIFFQIKPIIQADGRIKYLGWLNSDVLQEYLCASDLYVQLGSQSVTMQNALCCGSAAALYPFESHKFLLKNTVFYISNSAELSNLLEMISHDRSILENKREESFKLAVSLLDYKKIAAKIYETN